MGRQLQKSLPWLAFALFAGCALLFGWSEALFVSRGALPAGKYLAWAAFITFLAYSVYCSSRENIFRSVASMAKLHWGRQIGIDLYLGLGIFLFLIYLHQGSMLVVLLRLPPYSPSRTLQRCCISPFTTTRWSRNSFPDSSFRGAAKRRVSMSSGLAPDGVPGMTNGATRALIPAT
jgi:hypothetical protein